MTSSVQVGANLGRCRMRRNAASSSEQDARISDGECGQLQGRVAAAESTLADGECALPVGRVEEDDDDDDEHEDEAK